MPQMNHSTWVGKHTANSQRCWAMLGYYCSALECLLDAGPAILPSLMAQKRIEFNLPLFQVISLGSRESRQQTFHKSVGSLPLLP